MCDLKIKDIVFGKIDATNELQEVGNEFYLESFLPYNKYKINDFINGSRYFISGRKGTGKTALLKYLECQFALEKENLVIPIQFKSDFDNVDKRTLRAAAIDSLETIDTTETEKLQSYVIAWQVYLVYQIFKNNASRAGEYSTFVHDNEYKLMVNLLHLMYGETGSSKIVPKITKGAIEIGASTAKGFDASVKLELQMQDNTVNYELLAKKILHTYSNLTFDRTPVYILVDELELSVKNKKLRDSDTILIRDLILAVDKLNKLAKEKNYKIMMYASIRSDVLDNVRNFGYETNKCIEDFGVSIEWCQRDGNYIDNPLLKLIENKIHASEKAYGVPISDDVWSKYFIKRINGTEIRKYILMLSWYRPRDVIRLMTLVQNQCNEDTKIIDTKMFLQSIEEYSNKMWNELSEEMSLKYSADDMRAIKKIFTGITIPFTFGSFKKRLEEFSELYSYVKDFYSKINIADFLESMFDWGIIGNYGRRMVFKFRGYKDIDLSQKMMIHTPLHNFFLVVENDTFLSESSKNEQPANRQPGKKQSKYRNKQRA